MSCPQCQNDEIDSSGICLVCGYQVEASTADPHIHDESSRALSGLIEIDYSDSSKETEIKEEMPEWRRELSERLKAIRQKRESSGASLKQQSAAAPAISGAVQPRTAPIQARPVEKVRKRIPPARVHEKPAGPLPQQKLLQPLESPALKAPDPGEVQKIIDKATSRQPVLESAAPVGISLTAAPQDPDEGKLILLSRTLSGLVDLIFVVLCTGVFIIAADFFSGIVVLDSISLINLSALFLLIYFLYSVFFLAASNQTVGMMITDLRVVGGNEKRPLIRQLAGRCLGYLISFFGLGIGLLWSLFDPESLCFHDRISRTRVIRI
jgi:uncharacterized RDD family membrane protein YckC